MAEDTTGDLRESDHEKNDEPGMISVHDRDTDFEKTDTLSCPSQKIWIS